MRNKKHNSTHFFGCDVVYHFNKCHQSELFSAVYIFQKEGLKKSEEEEWESEEWVEKVGDDAASEGRSTTDSNKQDDGESVGKDGTDTTNTSKEESMEVGDGTELIINGLVARHLKVTTFFHLYNSPTVLVIILLWMCLDICFCNLSCASHFDAD